MSIKSSFLKFSYTVSDIIPFKIIRKISGQNIFLPFYHTISNDKLPHIKHLYPQRDIKTFKQDLDFLLKHFMPISAHDLIDHLNGYKKIDFPAFHLSFDDGLRENHEIIAPLLKSKGIPATFFINNSFVDNKDLFYRYKASLLIDHINKKPSQVNKDKISEILNSNSDIINSILSVNFNNKHLLDDIANTIGVNFKDFLNTQKPYMSSEQINDLHKSGFTIGAHSLNHPLYSDIDIKTQIYQTNKSINDIKNQYHLNYNLFAFPFTDDNVSLNLFNNINPIDISFGTSGLKKDCIENNLQRLPIEINNLSAEKIIKSEYLFYIFKVLVGKNKIERD